MAIWQCDFQLIPKCMAGNLEQECFWHGYTLNEESEKTVSEILPRTKSWSEDIIQYGDNDDTCIQLFIENEVLRDIRVRISFRDIEQAKLKAIVEFAKVNNGVFVLNKDIVEPEINQLIETIKCSDAFKFSTNPQKYLSQLSD